MKITIYGKDDCEKCAMAKSILYPASDYYHYLKINDHFPPEEASLITVSTNGQLPIIIIEGHMGRQILSVVDGKQVIKKCDSNTCSI